MTVDLNRMLERIACGTDGSGPVSCGWVNESPCSLRSANPFEPRRNETKLCPPSRCTPERQKARRTPLTSMGSMHKMQERSAVCLQTFSGNRER
jgi:hypothetical protein